MNWWEFPTLEMFSEGRAVAKDGNNFTHEVITACLAEQMDVYLFPWTLWAVLVTLRAGDEPQ